MTRRALLVLALAAAPRLAGAAMLSEVHYVMGTYLRVTVDDRDVSNARPALHRCFATVRRFEDRYSRFDPRSELSQLNALPNEARSEPLSADMAALLRRALELSTATAGAFDVSIGAVSELWRGASEWPWPTALTAAQATSGRGALRLAGRRLVRRRGTVIDLDGIAKGWAVDHCVADLRTAGFRRALINFGESSWYALGAPPQAAGWAVEIRALDGNSTLGTLTLRDEAVSVSGVFGHEHRVGTQRVGHIVDPRSGLPLTAPALAVVTAAAATDAEAWSKAVLIRGDALRPQGERGRWPFRGALLIRDDGIETLGRMRFTRSPRPQPITAAAEPLR